MIPRIVQPEILDSLPENHPDALHNRRDLRWINRLMGNPAWIEKHIRRYGQAEDSILEIGAGSGELGLRLHQSCTGCFDTITGLDFWSRPPTWPDAWPWHQEDALHYSGYANYSVILANLILHQFSDKELRELGPRLLTTARLLIISEPARRLVHLLQAKIGLILKFNAVTQHDSAVSIRAGFLGTELADLLGLDSSTWEWSVHTTWAGAYRLIAWRKDS